MMSMSKQRVFVLLCLMVTQDNAAAFSSMIYDLLAVYNGNFSNKEQYETQPGHDYIEARVAPVQTLALPGKAVVYGEWGCNGQAIIMNLMEITGPVNGVLTVTRYNFTDPRLHKAMSYDISQLPNLTPDQLTRDHDCNATFEPNGRGSFVGLFSECRHVVNGHHAAYGDIVNCNKLVIMLPVTAFTKISLVPYDVELVGKKYAIPGAPKNFDNPCSNYSWTEKPLEPS